MADTLTIGGKVYPVASLDVRFERDEFDYRTMVSSGVLVQPGPTRVVGELQLGNVVVGDFVNRSGELNTDGSRCTVMVKRVESAVDVNNPGCFIVSVHVESIGTAQNSKWDDMIDLIAEVCDG